MSKPTEDHPLELRGGASWIGTIACPRCKKEAPTGSGRCRFCGFSFRTTRTFDSAAAEAPESLVGQVINEKYRVTSVLGEGGFGVVYRVEFLLFDTNNIFALKLLHPALSQDPKFRQRFLREAALAMQLIHENTIQIREFGRTQDGSLFFTMDYCEGEPLNSVLAHEGYLPLQRSLSVARQVLSVMSHAHSRGIIHRDLKPENVFLERSQDRRDYVKVGDFGLAKSFVDTRHGTDITHGGILGTPRYMSPEQARGLDDLDHRSDLYSIGVMLYEMLYGEVPDDRLDADDQPVPQPPVQAGHVVPQAVWEVVRKAIQPRREDRYQSADAFLDAVRALPEYTPTYVEPPGLVTRRTAWWGRLAAACVVALAVALPLSLAGELFPGLPWSRGSEARSHRAGGSVRRDAETAERGSGREASAAGGSSSASRVAPPDASRGEDSASRHRLPSARVKDYAPVHVGATFTYAVHDASGPTGIELTYAVLDEVAPGVFQVQVVTRDPSTQTVSDRMIRWVIDEESNTLAREFTLPDEATGELEATARTELLRLPSVRHLQGDVIRGTVKVHREHYAVNEFTGCLLVESVEGSQRRLRYFKEGVGLVAIEVYDREAGPPVEAAAASDAPAAVRGGLLGPEAGLENGNLPGTAALSGRSGTEQDALPDSQSIFLEDVSETGSPVYARYLRLPSEPPAAAGKGSTEAPIAGSD